MKRTWHLWLVALLAGCAGVPAVPQEGRVAADSHALLGELALEQQAFDEAVEHFLTAAESVDEDASLAERAARIALDADLPEAGLQAAERWIELVPQDPRAHYFAGVFHARLERLDDAVAHLDRFVSAAGARGEAGAAVSLVVEALAAAPDAAAGTRVLRELLDGRPETPEGRLGLARLALRAGDFELALENARAATELRPGWVDAELLYARTLLVAGRSDESLELAARLANEHDDVEVQLQYAELLLSAGRTDEARERLETLRDDNPGLPEATRALAFLALSEDQLDEAQRLFDELRAHSRFRDEAFYYLGRVAERQQRDLQATRAYSRVTEGPRAVEAQLRTANILRTRMSDPEGALRHLEQFGAANEEFATEMLVARGQLLVQMGRPAEALELLGDALDANPDDAALHEARAQLYVTMANEASGRGAYDEAESTLEDGLALYPDNVSLRYAQALLLQEQGEMRGSERVLRRLVDDHPDDPVFLNALGYLLTDELDRHGEAREYIQKALAMDPDNAAIIDSMGWVLFNLGEYRSALDYLDRAYRLESDPEIAAHLVDVHWALGERERALSVLDDALERNPDSRHLNEVEQRLRR